MKQDQYSYQNGGDTAPNNTKVMLFLNMVTKPHWINIPIGVSQQTCIFIKSSSLEKKENFYCRNKKGMSYLKWNHNESVSHSFHLSLVKQKLAAIKGHLAHSWVGFSLPTAFTIFEVIINS